MSSNLNEEEIIKLLEDFNKIKINSFAMQFVNIPYPKLQEAIQGLLDLYKQEKEKNKKYTASEIQNIEKQAYYKGRADEELKLKDVKDDLTTVYISGFYDGEKKWKDKIKEEIDELKNMKVNGEIFTTAVNFAIKEFEKLLEN